MERLDQIIRRLKKVGCRLTKIRRATIQVLLSTSAPMTEQEIRTKLFVFKLRPNKTTIYRQLQKFLKLGLMREIEFGDGRKRYELAGTDHHHHLVCLDCKSVEDIKLADKFNSLEKRIDREKKFKITGHSLEFFGLCENCH